MCCKHGAFRSSNSSSVLLSGSGTLSAHEERTLWNKIRLQMALPAPPIPLCIMCVHVCTQMLNDQTHWNICRPVFSQNGSGCHVLYITAVCTLLSCSQGPVVWHSVRLGFVGQEARGRPCHWGYLPLTLGQGDTGQGEGRKIHPPLHTLPPQKWIKIGKQHARSA